MEDGRSPIPPRRLAWLEGELERWRADGLVDEAGAAAILGRYASGAQRRLVALLLGLGAALLAVGVVLLIAANVDLDEVGPLARVLGVAALWLGCAVAAELVRGAATGPLRTLGAAAFGATVLQAAQSLQVPAYEPSLLVAWSVGAMAYAYACGGRGPLVIGLGAAVGGACWALARDGGDGSGIVLGLVLLGAALVAVAALHEGSARARFAPTWRAVGVLLTLAGAIGVAFPEAVSGRDALPGMTVVAAVVVALVVVAAVLRSRAPERAEVLVAAAGAAAVAALVLLAPVDPVSTFDGREAPTAQVLFTLAGCAVVLGLAVWAALLGARRDAPALTDLAVATLVLFVVLQSFGLLAPLLSGAGLVLAVGAILVACGVAAGRGRRVLREEAVA